MTRKSKREIERTIQSLEDDGSSSEGGLCIFLGGRSYETVDAAPRPELVVPDVERGGYRTATPNALPDAYDRPILFLTDAVVETWDKEHREGTVPVSEVWDSMTDEDLQAEYEYRTQHGDPVPEVLEPYAQE